MTWWVGVSISGGGDGDVRRWPLLVPLPIWPPFVPLEQTGDPHHIILYLPCYSPHCVPAHSLLPHYSIVVPHLLYSPVDPLSHCPFGIIHWPHFITFVYLRFHFDPHAVFTFSLRYTIYVSGRWVRWLFTLRCVRCSFCVRFACTFSTFAICCCSILRYVVVTFILPLFSLDRFALFGGSFVYLPFVYVCCCIAFPVCCVYHLFSLISHTLLRSLPHTRVYDVPSLTHLSYGCYVYTRSPAFTFLLPFTWCVLHHVRSPLAFSRVHPPLVRSSHVVTFYVSSICLCYHTHTFFVIYFHHTCCCCIPFTLYDCVTLLLMGSFHLLRSLRLFFHTATHRHHTYPFVVYILLAALPRCDLLWTFTLHLHSLFVLVGWTDALVTFIIYVRSIVHHVVVRCPTVIIGICCYLALPHLPPHCCIYCPPHAFTYTFPSHTRFVVTFVRSRAVPFALHSVFHCPLYGLRVTIFGRPAVFYFTHIAYRRAA